MLNKWVNNNSVYSIISFLFSFSCCFEFNLEVLSMYHTLVFIMKFFYLITFNNKIALQCSYEKISACFMF